MDTIGQLYPMDPSSGNVNYLWLQANPKRSFPMQFYHLSSGDDGYVAALKCGYSQWLRHSTLPLRILSWKIGSGKDIFKDWSQRNCKKLMSFSTSFSGLPFSTAWSRFGHRTSWTSWRRPSSKLLWSDLPHAVHHLGSQAANSFSV